MLTALSLTQALAWKSAIDDLFVVIFPSETYGIMSSFLMATLITTFCIGFAWLTSRCLRTIENIPNAIPQAVEIQLSNRGTARSDNLNRIAR